MLMFSILTSKSFYYSLHCKRNENFEFDWLYIFGIIYSVKNKGKSKTGNLIEDANSSKLNALIVNGGRIAEPLYYQYFSLFLIIFRLNFGLFNENLTASSAKSVGPSCGRWISVIFQLPSNRRLLILGNIAF